MHQAYNQQASGSPLICVWLIPHTPLILHVICLDCVSQTRLCHGAQHQDPAKPTPDPSNTQASAMSLGLALASGWSLAFLGFPWLSVPSTQPFTQHPAHSTNQSLNAEFDC